MEKDNKLNNDSGSSTSPTEALSFESPYFEQFLDMLVMRIYNCQNKTLKNNLFKCDGTYKETLCVLRCLHLNVEKSIKFLQENGGFCDCEVIYNVKKK